jgi:hypothetical protein
VPPLLRRALPCLGALALGCGSALGSAIDAFSEGRLPDSARELRALEGAAPRFERQEWARYALYRGLTEFALGDLERAEQFLLPLKREVDREPKTLSDAERGALFTAFRSMGRMP